MGLDTRKILLDIHLLICLLLAMSACYFLGFFNGIYCLQNRRSDHKSGIVVKVYFAPGITRSIKVHTHSLYLLSNN